MKEKIIYPVAITIFGAKGDLTHRKLIPALYNLFIGDHLPPGFVIFCVDYLAVNDGDFKKDLLAGINEFSRSGRADEKKWNEFSGKLFYIQGDFLKIETFSSLKQKLDCFDKQNKKRGIRLFYYAVAPRFIEVISESLYKLKLCHQEKRDRIVVEKPFGTDLDSSKKLNRFLGKRFAENQIYRIDHYLGKETVQNILAFRFANYVFEPLWNNEYIDHIQISVAEQVGVGKRGGYYDSSGALRDMIQNHLMQLLCLVAMEPMVSFQADEIRNKKVDVLHAVRPILPDAVAHSAVRGQYGVGWIAGKKVRAYRQ